MSETDARAGRRSFVTAAGAGALAVPLALAIPPACRGKSGADAEGDGVGAVEDLMREHGVIRRVLVVYRAAAGRLRAGAPVPSAPLADAATLIRRFAEDYHERLLEEAHVFPAVKGAGGDAARAIDPLLAQHQRGREMTDRILGVASASAAKPIGAPDAAALARTLDAFAEMYEAHAALEDTVIFPAWKKALGAARVADMGEEFERIERRTFGHDGFDDGVARVTAIEHALGLDLAAILPASSPPT